MKNSSIITLSILGLVFISCETRTYEDISPTISIPEKVDYVHNVKPIIQNNCIACHSPGNAAEFFPLTDYTLVKNAIDNILDRVQRPIGDPDKMPQGGSLSPANIELLIKWKSDGLIE